MHVTGSVSAEVSPHYSILVFDEEELIEIMRYIRDRENGKEYYILCSMYKEELTCSQFFGSHTGQVKKLYD